jgi:hypothetical protein
MPGRLDDIDEYIAWCRVLIVPQKFPVSQLKGTCHMGAAPMLPTRNLALHEDYHSRIRENNLSVGLLIDKIT